MYLHTEQHIFVSYKIHKILEFEPIFSITKFLLYLITNSKRINESTKINTEKLVRKC